MTIINLISIIILSILTLFIAYALVQTLIEKEKRASRRLGLLTLMWVLFLLTTLFIFTESFQHVFIPVLSLIIIIPSVILLFPWPVKKWNWIRGKPDRIDERNIMFSRAELEPGTERFNNYYKEFPQHKNPDNDFRKHAGLLKEGSAFYQPWLFGAADASFYTLESLHSKTDGEITRKPGNFKPDGLSKFIDRWANDMGCHSMGITLLEPHHLYHTGGRKHNYGDPVINNHKFAIAFTVEMDFERVKSAPRGPIIMESSAQYLKAGTIAVQIAAFIRNLGYSAKAHIDGKYQLRCTEVAKDAGLGELGRMSLLMTPDLGPRVRIGVVTTDIPLELSIVIADPTLLKFCRICKKCSVCCPAQAISSEDPKEIGGTEQWTINQEACFTYWCKAGTDCGRCISVCPYSHPDNLLHRIVRFFIKKSPLFLIFAIKMDDWLYGRKPPEKQLPGWMEID